MDKPVLELSVSRNLDEATRKQGVLIDGKVYSLHIADNEVIVTDNKDYSKIYSIQNIGFYNLLEKEDE